MCIEPRNIGSYPSGKQLQVPVCIADYKLYQYVAPNYALVQRRHYEWSTSKQTWGAIYESNVPFHERSARTLGVAHPPITSKSEYLPSCNHHSAWISPGQFLLLYVEELPDIQ